MSYTGVNMNKLLGLPVLLVCFCMVLAASAHAAEKKTVVKKLTLNELQQKIEQLAKAQQEQKARMLDEKPNKETQPKFEPYSYP